MRSLLDGTLIASDDLGQDDILRGSVRLAAVARFVLTR